MDNKDIKILVDMDGVICDFNNTLYDSLIKMGFQGKENWENSYSIYDWVEYKSKADFDYKLDNLLCTMEFWRDLPFIELNVDIFLFLLYTRYDVYIVTAPWRIPSESIRGKYRWVLQNLPFFDLNKIIFEKEKWNLSGDYIIEDNPETILNMQNMKTIVYSHLYNKGVKSDFRLDSWQDIKNILL